ncbi:MAG: S-layer glycoprotein N-glycosyltransferase AglJ [Methanomicrobiales archaeon]|nr:S-layer glycoprotein N-glycosyltransferase AglJ [Methanomicrobiales archaeon]
MAIDQDAVCIFIPTLNEAPTIGPLVTTFRKKGFSHILVMDGNSTDATVRIAREAGAVVHTQSGKGKGEAIIEAIELIEQPYILMLDGDGTYDPDDADAMLEPLFEGADHVIGNRLAFPEKGALTALNHFGNEVINYLFKVAHGAYLYDILSGYRAFTRAGIRQMQLSERGFEIEIETEIAVEAVRNNQKTVIVPVKYGKRPGTETKLHPFKDGFKIARTVYRLAKINNPLFYFGLIGIIILIAGGLTGLYVVYEWMNGIERIPMTILTLLLIMVGFNIFMFGVIADMLLTFHREVMREIHRLRER